MSPTVRVEESVQIERSQAEVWEAIADYAFDLEWRKGLREMTPDPPGPPAPGTKVHEVVTNSGRDYVADTEVTDLDPGASPAGSRVGGRSAGPTAVEPCDPTRRARERSSPTPSSCNRRAACACCVRRLGLLVRSGLKEDLQTLKGVSRPPPRRVNGSAPGTGRQSKTDKKLYKKARDGGLRKRVARQIADASAEVEQKSDGKAPKALRKTAKELRAVIETIEDRAAGGPAKRKASAQKAARTRQRNAARRSATAKKAARTRARSEPLWPGGAGAGAASVAGSCGVMSKSPEPRWACSRRSRSRR